MKKLAILLIFLSLTRIGVAYAADDTVSNIRGSYFFGTSSREGADVVNSVLALLIGPEGKPGLLGPAGKSAYDIAKANGFTGTEGEWLVSLVGDNGKSAYDLAKENGFAGTQEEWLRSLVGTPGGAGAAGTSVTVTDEPSGANCTNGGKKLTSATGIAYVCNGTNGTGGGGSGGGSIGYGAGEVSVGSCTDTATVGVKSQFTGSDFVFETITVSQIASACSTKTLSIFFKIKATGTLKNLTDYTNNDVVKCTYTIPNSNVSPIPQLSISAGNSSCFTLSNTGTTFAITRISTADYTDAIGFEIN